jgi:NAD(P)-dependent dehydrogenase (short-subunit alcohol dehydrogenase family)
MSTILITGANGGLGPAVVDRLLNDGYRVLAAVGQAGAGSLPANKNLEVSIVDLLDEKEANGFVEASIRQHADIRAAVLLVGGFAMGKLTSTSGSDLEKMISLNFYSAFNIVKPLLSHFLGRPEGGQVILIGARPGLSAAAGKDFFAYSLSKAMIFKLAEFINAEGKDKAVTATVIVPSTIDTEANRKAMPDADFSKWVPAEKIADAISFALSDTGGMLRESVIKIYNRA